ADLRAREAESSANQAKALRLQNALRPRASKGFFIDLVSESDGEGITLHRFQICVWTVVLGMIFVVSVFTDLAMPTFGTTLLALMGISGATYVGFKWPEKS